MKHALKYIPPTSLQELKDFQKLEQDIENEIWDDGLLERTSFYTEKWNDYEISNYGRLRNIKTGKLKSSYVSFKKHLYIHSFYHCIQDDFRVNDKMRICTLMPFLEEKANYRPKDGNIFNLFVENILPVQDEHYQGNCDKLIKEWIDLDGNKTKYTIDTLGVIKDEKKSKIINSDKRKPYDFISLYFNGKRYQKSLARWLAETFIQNPHNLRYAKSMNLPCKPFLDTGFNIIEDIYWTDGFWRHIT